MSSLPDAKFQSATRPVISQMKDDAMAKSDSATVPVVNLPNALTLLRLLLVPVFGWLLLAQPTDIGWRWWATAVFTVALLTDFFDGKIARKYNLITNFGKLWDSIADKAITGMAWVGLSIIGELPWWITIIVLVREWGITILRFAILKWGVMAANRGGKLKTMLQTWVLGIWIAPFQFYFTASDAPQVAWITDTPAWLAWPKLILMVITILVTVITGLDYLREARQMRQR
jgi:CDP-diacylglycerol--glycerol-3-phosphate 3-phosphatidyltransferase